jgi:hypothetical protein
LDAKLIALRCPLPNRVVHRKTRAFAAARSGSSQLRALPHVLLRSQARHPHSARAFAALVMERRTE